MKEWFKEELKEFYLERKNKKEGIFSPDYVEKMLQDYLKEKGVNYNKLWLLFVFELWREKWM